MLNWKNDVHVYHLELFQQKNLLSLSLSQQYKLPNNHKANIIFAFGDKLILLYFLYKELP